MQFSSNHKKFRGNVISRRWNAFFVLLMSVLALLTVIPLVLVFIVSFSSAESLTYKGYTFFPQEWTILAYENLVNTGSALLQSYLMTIFYTFTGTALSLFVMSMFAFVLAQKRFKHRRAFAFFAFFTTLFSGGLVPSYILNARYLHLNNTIWIFLLPGMVSSFNVIILRTFIQTSIPDSLFEAARIDGANDWTTYCRIVIPLSKAGLATVGLFSVVGRWNDWFTGVLYIENPKLVPVMTFLQRIQNDLDYLKNNSSLSSTPEGLEMLKSIPSESTRMAITILVVLPLLVAYPFFQKYFVKGLTVGSVKG